MPKQSMNGIIVLPLTNYQLDRFLKTEAQNQHIDQDTESVAKLTEGTSDGKKDSESNEAAINANPK
jgi:hypothetical protein